MHTWPFPRDSPSRPCTWYRSRGVARGPACACGGGAAAAMAACTAAEAAAATVVGGGRGLEARWQNGAPQRRGARPSCPLGFPTRPGTRRRTVKLAVRKSAALLAGRIRSRPSSHAARAPPPSSSRVRRRTLCLGGARPPARRRRASLKS
eukprot:366442-Chlamydomonas_euryale.AAC.10